MDRRPEALHREAGRVRGFLPGCTLGWQAEKSSPRKKKIETAAAGVKYLSGTNSISSPRDRTQGEGLL
jgi:hypothetical protein